MADSVPETLLRYLILLLTRALVFQAQKVSEPDTVPELAMDIVRDVVPAPDTTLAPTLTPVPAKRYQPFILVGLATLNVMVVV
jgi:hypothetical protein